MEIILVTGGTGLIGSALQSIEKNANEKWIFLSSKVCDLRDLNQTEEIFNLYQPTKVIHLAAKVGGLFANENFKADFLNDNLRINQNVLNSCFKYHVKKVISCLSTCIFPDSITYPIDESMIHLGPPHSSNYGYAYAKRMIDITNKCFNEQYQCNFTSIIPTNIFGKYDNYNLKDSHVIPGLIHKCYLAQQNNEPFIVKGTGAPLRQFIYSQDLAKLIVWALTFYTEIEPIILSVPESDEITIKQVVESITKAFDFKGPIVWDSSFSDGQYKKTANNAKLMQYLPDFNFTPFDIALQKSVDWFKENYNSSIIRK
jgi:GDP-L-fucose synthase